LSEAIEASDPDMFTTKFAKAGRESKILLDYLRNNRTNTSIAAYSTRARRGATVSVPITWNELRLSPESFTIKTVPARLKRMRADPWKSYWSARQRLSDSIIKAVKGQSSS
jgi:bifunctional non-homologous end joining protein LigD